MNADNPEGETSKPVMGENEASWHETQAGHRAREKAQQEGDNKTVVEALLDGASGPVKIAGYELKPASQGTIWVIEKMAEEFPKYAKKKKLKSSPDPKNPGHRELLEIALCALAFADPRRVYSMLNMGKMKKLVEEAERNIWELSIAESAALQVHFEREMARIYSMGEIKEEDTPGKSE